MHVISKGPFSQAAKKYPNQRRALEAVYRVLRKGSLDSPDHMKCVFPSLDNFKHREKWWVINIAGNHLRIVAFIQFAQNRIYVKHIVTHKEYDRLCWRYQKGEIK